MAIITVSREYGSEGTLIGRRVSESLGYQEVDKNLIGNVLHKYGMTAFKKLIEEKHNIWDRYDYNNMQMVGMLGKTMLAFASLDNCVILGRGGFVVLNEYTNVLNVLIQAPFEKRVENVVKRNEAADEKAAKQLVLENDEIRKKFLRVFYSIQCCDTGWYNLVIDTGKVKVETAQKWIIEAAEELDKADIDLRNSTLSLEVNRVLLDAVKSAIR